MDWFKSINVSKDQVNSNCSANTTAKNLKTEETDTSSSTCNKCNNDQQTLLLNSGQCSTSSKESNIAPDDPICDIPKNKLERQSRISRGPFQPRLNLFPRSKIGNKQRSFQLQWYEKYIWLEYSPAKNAAFCFYCRFFSCNNTENKVHTDTSFISKEFRNWHRANECFTKHQLSKHHVLSCSSWSNFKEENCIAVLLEENRQAYLSKQEEERRHNRSIMEQLIDIVLCLEKDARPFRDHIKNEDSLEESLFLDLVSMLLKYDPILAKHVQESPRNDTYLSNSTQNDLTVALHNVVQRNIVSSLNGKLVSIMVDDTSDCGHHEQISIVVRYFDNEKNSPVERFVSIQKLLTVDAESIFDKLNDVLGILKLDWSSVMSVCFDGASTMSECNAGVQMKCKEKNGELLYIHSYTHCLNLVLVDECTSSKQNRTVFDFFGVIQTLYAFMEASSVRHTVMEKILQEVGSQLVTLKSFSNTRWAYRAEAVAAVKQNYSILLQALQEIIETTRLADVKIKARGLTHELNSFKFIFVLHMMHPILQMLVKVSKAIQAPELNLLTAMTCVKSLRNSLVSMSSDPEKFESIYNETIEICALNNISIPSVKRRKVSSRIDETFEFHRHSDTKKEQERIGLFYPLLDSMITGIDQRFEEETCHIITAMGKLLSLDIGRGDMRLITNKFKVSLDELEAELELLRNYDVSVPRGSTTNTMREWLKWLKESDRFSMFQAFYKCVQCFSVIPITSCSCERDFSKVTHVKNKLKITMTQQRLDSLMILCIEKELASSVNYDDVIEEFMSIKSFSRTGIIKMEKL